MSAKELNADEKTEVKTVEDRKFKILAAIVDEYILKGEPVGSKAIANLPQINVSPATVRNDMATLEQLGYLEQPHTSAGRIPTYKGYRLYIDKLMNVEPLSQDEKQRLDTIIEEESGQSEEALMEKATEVLAELTQCAVVASNVAPQYSVISKVEVIPTGKRLYVLLLITSSGNIKNKVCRLKFDLTTEQLDFFKSYMEQNLHGVQLDTISDEMMEKLIMAMGTYMVTLSPLLEGVYEMSQDLMENEFVMSGEKNLLSCKEFDTTQIVQLMEHKDDLTRLLDASFSGLQVMFGTENDDFVMSNSSMIVSPIQKGDKKAGTLGIIGPMRIDYAKIIPYVEYFTDKISEIISDDEDDDSRKDIE